MIKDEKDRREMREVALLELKNLITNIISVVEKYETNLKPETKEAINNVIKNRMLDIDADFAEDSMTAYELRQQKVKL